MMRCSVLALAVLFATLSPIGASAAIDHYRAYVDGRWGQIHVRVDGPAGGPTLILVHKMVWSSMEFSRVQPELARLGIRTIAVDLPGYGLSDGPTKAPTAEDYADDLLPVLDRFKLSRVDMLGTDTGTAVTVAFANRHPDRIGKVILEGPTLFEASVNAKLAAETEIDRTPSPDGSEFTRREQEILSSIAPHALSNEAMHTGSMQFFQAGPHYLWGHQAVVKYDMAKGLKQLAAPTMILGFPGKASFASASLIKAVRPDFTYVSLDFTGLMADFDDPGDWAQAVASFIESPALKGAAP